MQAVAHRLISDLDAVFHDSDTLRILSLAGHRVEEMTGFVEDADDDEMPALVGPPFPVWLPADAAPGPMQLRVLRGPCCSPAWGFANSGRQG